MNMSMVVMVAAIVTAKNDYGGDGNGDCDRET
jgi:hypothetical protein